MSPDANDPWRRLPARKQFGEQLRRRPDPVRQPALRSHITRRALVTSSAGLAAAILAVVLIVGGGGTALAGDVINKAPAAAEKSGTVNFHSTLAITVSGHTRPGISEHGMIDFTTGAYSTWLEEDESSAILERRSLNGILYSAKHPDGKPPTRWTATRLQAGDFNSESDAFTDPPAVFRTLASIKAPVRRLGLAEVGGVSTRHYRLLTNLAVILGSQAGYTENLQGYRRVTATLDVWLDPKGRPRKVQQTFTGRTPAGDATLTTTVNFAGYEQPVSVSPPSRKLVHFTGATAAPNPFGEGPGALIARRLFFTPGRKP